MGEPVRDMLHALSYRRLRMKKSSGRKLLRSIARENIRKASKQKQKENAKPTPQKARALRKKQKAKRKQAKMQRRAA